MARNDSSPVFIDLETRSACDLRKEGSIPYAAHPTTQILTAAWTDDYGETYHLWLPGAVDGIPDEQIKTQKLEGVEIYTDASVPDELLALATRPWMGHNTWGFDRVVWAALMPPEAQPIKWHDTMPMAASIGLPQGLDAIGKRLSGEADGGKDKVGKSLLKKHSRCKGPHYPEDKNGVKSKKLVDDTSIVNVPVVAQMMIGRYNIKDVQITVELAKLLESEVNLNPAERRVLMAHDSCNQRGVRIDGDFVRALEDLSVTSAAHAFTRIAEITKDDKNKLTDKTLNSRPTVLAWLEEKGVNLGKSLAKGIIAKFIDANTTEDGSSRTDDDEADLEDDDTGDRDADTKESLNPNLPTVVEVLTLRMSALRVTSGKIAAARARCGKDGRIRHWSSYWAAHTGRWAGRGIQPHNLPRPKEGVDTWDLCSLYEETKSLSYDAVHARMPISALNAEGKPLYPRLSVDDAASGLLRSIFIPNDGETFMAADLANIEARILAWLAGETWLMKAFWSGEDPYMKMAEKIFGGKSLWKQYPDPKKKGEFLPLKKHPFRQVGKVVALGSGYQLGADQFSVYAAANQIDLAAVGATAPECIYSYRRMHPAIAGVEAGDFEGRPYFKGGLWDQLNAAAISACNGTPSSVGGGKVHFEREGRHLVVTLPSGRRLVYRDAEVRQKDYFGKMKDTVTYLSPRFGRKALYGGSLAENIVQAISRDVLAYGFVLCEEDDLPIVLHVHDELCSSAAEDRFPDFMSHVTTCPAWLTDFPLDAEGSCAPRYAKAPPPGVKEVVYRNGELKA